MTNMEKVFLFCKPGLVLALFFTTSLFGCSLGLGQKMQAWKAQKLFVKACNFWASSNVEEANVCFASSAGAFQAIALQYESQHFAGKQAYVLLQAGELNYSAGRWQDAASFFTLACDLYQKQGQYLLAAEYFLKVASARSAQQLPIAAAKLKFKSAQCRVAARINQDEALAMCCSIMQDLLDELKGAACSDCLPIAHLAEQVTKVLDFALDLDFKDNANVQNKCEVQKKLLDNCVRIAFAFINLGKQGLAGDMALLAIGYAKKYDSQSVGDSAVGLPLLHSVWENISHADTRTIFEELYAPILKDLIEVNVRLGNGVMVGCYLEQAATLVEFSKKSIVFDLLQVIREAAIVCENKGLDEIAYRLLDFLRKQNAALGLHENAALFEARANFRYKRMIADNKRQVELGQGLV